MPIVRGPRTARRVTLIRSIPPSPRPPGHRRLNRDGGRGGPGRQAPDPAPLADRDRRLGGAAREPERGVLGEAQARDEAVPVPPPAAAVLKGLEAVDPVRHQVLREALPPGRGAPFDGEREHRLTLPVPAPRLDDRLEVRGQRLRPSRDSTLRNSSARVERGATGAPGSSA